MHSIDWVTYKKFQDTFGEKRLRHTYDRGSLELMSPSFRHDHAARSLATMVKVLAREYGYRVSSAGSTTLSREEANRGLEPDESFYIQNIAAILGQDDIDLSRMPPPDLAVEIDVTRSMLNRLSVYESMRVPEIWRCDGTVVEFRVLRPDGRYEVVPRSPTFPVADPDELLRFVEASFAIDDLELLDQFRAWVRQQLGRPA
jgi:Uma2 family endonuclease